MKNPIEWMAGNHVASNILMLVLIIGGLIIGGSVKQEIFPEFEIEIITVSVIYPGASPADVEEGIILPLENAISSIDNIDRIKSTASENVGTVSIEIIDGADVDDVLTDVKSEVDRILTFPLDAEEPMVSKVTNRMEVINLAIYGDVSELALFENAERVRDDLMNLPKITQVEVKSVRPQEISISISESNLRRYNLTLNHVAAIIKRASVDIPGGSVKTEGGEVLIRTTEKRYTRDEFESIAILTSPTGERVLLGDIADVKDAFLDVDSETLFNGKRAALINVYRVSDQTPKEIAKAVKDYIEFIEDQLPASISLTIWQDRSVLLEDRIQLLLKNGFLGIILVLGILALFLEVRLAFFVALGIVISFLGAMMFMPLFGVSINMISLFAFITVLGIVVDDAIIVGENVFVHYRRGMPIKIAAIQGTMEIKTAVVFAVLTTIAAFSPLLFAEGIMGKIMWVLPIIVIIVLGLSLVESLFILPAHLSSGLIQSKAPIWVEIEKQRSKFDRVVKWQINVLYSRMIVWSNRNLYITVAISIAILLITVGFISGGFIKFNFIPEVDADWISVNIDMSPGTSFIETKKATLHIIEASRDALEEFEKDIDKEDSDLLHTFTSIGSQTSFQGPGHNTSATFSSSKAMIILSFREVDERKIELKDFIFKWREKVGDIPNLDRLTMKSELMGGGSDLDIQLAHEDYSVLEKAIEKVKSEMLSYTGIYEVNDSYSEGKSEIKLKLRDEAAGLGLSESDLGMQVRSAFYGAEALRLQRGQNEVKVMVRYPEEERKDLNSISNMVFRSAIGAEIPFGQAAEITESRGYSIIQRTDRKRVVNITAEVNSDIANAEEVLSDLKVDFLEQLSYDFPGMTYNLEGQTMDSRDTIGSLLKGFLIALVVIYSLLAIPFKSYAQPIIVMSAIPFGIVGAVVGHVILGFNLSLISMFGIVALSGIVVNDSLVMIDFINKARLKGMDAGQAVVEAGKRRFRPIILTSLTTFFGLTPMMLETSLQARLMIPMAISLGFGVLFATTITLLLVPAFYLILNDIIKLFTRKKVSEEVQEIEFADV